VLFEVQVLLHTICPVGHAWHWPLTQVCPATHLWFCPGPVHPPQLLGSVATFVQVPGFVPQTISPVGQAPHVLLAHVSPVAHCLPQAPQLLGSVVSLAQTPRPWPAVPLGQSVAPFGQTQWPEMHAAPESHTKPQEPQLLASLVVSTQPAEHAVRPVVQTQVGLEPAGVWHVEPTGHTVPHVPQLKLSVLVLVQTPGLLPLAPHTVAPAGQLHVDAAHVPPLGHALPQTPQSVTLVCRLSHPSGQAVVPVGQPQMPLVQVAPAPCGHFMPHWLQLAGSVCTLVQTLLQMLVMPAGQLHVPLVQVAPTGQVVPHVPQLLLSVFLLVHVPLQTSGVGAVQVPPLLLAEVDELVPVEVDELVPVEVDELAPVEVDVPVPVEVDELVPVEVDVPPVPEPPVPPLDELVAMPPVPPELLVMPPVPPVLELVVELLEVVVMPPAPPVPPLDPPLPQPSAACISAAVALHISHDRRFIRVLLVGDASLVAGGAEHSFLR
jgi:hypothetical protein